MDDHIDDFGREKYVMNSNNQHKTKTSSSPKRRPPLPLGVQRSTIPDLITSILSDHDIDAQTHHAGLSQLNDSPSTFLEFPPGSLSLTHAQTLKHCFADPKVYSKHLLYGSRNDGSNVPVSYSDKHKLAYVMLPKSGSSTARYMMKEEFHASQEWKSLQPQSFREGMEMEGVEVMTFIRDPLKRFYSQYDEAYVRTAPWQASGNLYHINPDTKKQVTPHPFSYIYENIHTYHDYEDVFCPISTRKNRKQCIDRPSQENGTLSSRFERFAQDYDGRSPFDVHLTLQVPMMSSANGSPLHMTQIYNTTDSEGGWKRIRQQFLGENAVSIEEGEKNGGVIAGRSYPRRFNSDLVSVKTQRRICELALLDYCCLNLPLPDVCKGNHYAAGDGTMRGLFCVLGAGGKDSRTDGLIQPGIFPDELRFNRRHQHV